MKLGMAFVLAFCLAGSVHSQRSAEKIIEPMHEASVKLVRHAHWSTVLPDGTAAVLSQEIPMGHAVRLYSPQGFVAERLFPWPPESAYTAITSGPDGKIYLYSAHRSESRRRQDFVLILDQQLNTLKELSIDVAVETMVVDRDFIYLAGLRRRLIKGKRVYFPHGVHVYTLDGEWVESFGEVDSERISDPINHRFSRLSLGTGGRIIYTICRHAGHASSGIYRRIDGMANQATGTTAHRWPLETKIEDQESIWIQSAFPLSPLETIVEYREGDYMFRSTFSQKIQVLLLGPSFQPIARVKLDGMLRGVDKNHRVIYERGPLLIWARLE
jgi:hypothetical protein